MRIKKEPYVARKMCATQGSIFSFFLGISEDAKLCLFQGVRRCPDFPKTFFVTAKIIFAVLLSLCKTENGVEFQGISDVLCKKKDLEGKILQGLFSENFMRFQRKWACTET